MSDTATDLGKGLASAAAGKIPGFGPFSGPVVDWVFGSLFGNETGPPSYFEQVYARITQIVQTALDAATTDHINAAIKNVLDAMRVEYSPRKKAANLSLASDRQDLFALLQKYDSTFLAGPDGMLSMLKQQDGNAAFNAYLIGAGLRLTIYQEMAVTDPAQSSPADWAKSSYGVANTGSVALFAKETLEYATSTWANIKVQRRRSISVGVGTLDWQRRMYDDLSTTNDYRTYYREMYNYLDFPEQQQDHGYEDWEGPFSSNGPDYPSDFDTWEPHAIENLYQREAIPALINELGDPDSLIANWTLLIAQPLPAS